ncbi:bet1-like SNARE 1-1 isoform X3 [Phalaenopsis equestris]|uniref:bet1-like SNARE 1-1 isoform X3 n=1 Tax=Phalaenopsis equestris TaxID=78828 RepID=UPI0009E2432E|nr:bet1-like SNARE 1-1 isoform X3 [Phalaenopsis equestris]
MNSRRDRRSSRAVLFDGIEEGGVRASYNAHEIDEHGNEKAIDGLQDRVNILKRLTGDIHGELETHNRLLDKMALRSGVRIFSDTVGLKELVVELLGILGMTGGPQHG